MSGDEEAASGRALGGRLRRLRLARGLSVRATAERARLDKNTVLRLERGDLPSSGRSLALLCAALGVSPEELSGAAGPAAAPAIAGRAEPLLGAGVSTAHPLCSRLRGGALEPLILDLSGETPPAAHAGEEFVYCLSGVVRLSVGGRVLRLGPGESAAFWGSEPHRYAPEGGAPARALVVRTSGR